MTTFIYYFGAVAFAGAVARAVWALVAFLEKGGRRR